MGPRGAYSADRAASLSGVPKSTVHYWARKEILVPIRDIDRRLPSTTCRLAPLILLVFAEDDTINLGVNPRAAQPPAGTNGCGEATPYVLPIYSTKHSS